MFEHINCYYIIKEDDIIKTIFVITKTNEGYHIKENGLDRIITVKDNIEVIRKENSGILLD